jgi:hypothetical protein
MGSQEGIEEQQKTLCIQYATGYVATPGNTKTGFALSTKGQIPINGLRHPIVGETSGW